MPKENKATNFEVSKRIETIFDLMIKGFTPTSIFQYVANETDWNVSSRQVYNYIRTAQKRYIRESKHSKDIELGKALNRLGLLFSRSLDIQDYKTALSIQKEISETLGLKAANKIDHTTQGDKINVINLGMGVEPSK